MAKSNESKGTGTRYTPEQKKEIADFLKSKNGERGAIRETMEKFGVSYVTIRNIQNGKLENAKPGKKADSKPSNGKVSEEKGRPGRKPGNAPIVRLLAKFRNDYERLGNKIAKMEELVTGK